MPKATRPRKPPQPRKDSDPEQLERFKRAAPEIEVDETPGALDRAFNTIIKRAVPPKPKRSA
jgi:hypothetical protein